MVITEMDKGKEKLLAVARTYLYSVDIQIVDSAKHLRDKLGYLGKLFLFRVLQPACSDKRSLRKKCLFSHDFKCYLITVKKCWFKKTQRYVLFCSCHLLMLFILFIDFI